MVGEPREMRHRARKLGEPSIAQNGLEPALFQSLVAGSLIGKETELGDKADIGQCHIVTDEEHSIRLQGLLDAAGVGRERLFRAGVSVGRNGGLAQGKEVDLRVAREDQARVEKAVDARCLVEIAAIECKPLVPEPGDGAHDAVRLEDSDPAVGAERRRHRAEGMSLKESIGLEQPPARKTDAADPFRSLRGTLVVVDAYIGTIRAKAVIDTGGQVTIANLALKDALAHRNGTPKGKVDLIEGATKDIQKGELLDDTPAISIGSIQIHDPSVTYGDLYIFRQWKLLNEPAILIGMDSLGLLDTLIIDYRRHELQLRMPNAG